MKIFFFFIEILFVYTFGLSPQLPPNQPKKRKKKQIVSPDSDNNEDDVGVSVHYYREESAGIGDSQPCQKAVNKTTVIDKPSRKENITQVNRE